MKVLLDTHITLWALIDSNRLPAKAKQIITDSNNEIFYSLVSAWEVAIKHSIHPDLISLSESEFLDYCSQAGYSKLNIRDSHILMLHTLHRSEDSPKHNDPFDKMLISQAKAENMRFITHDYLLPYYNESCLLFV